MIAHLALLRFVPGSDESLSWLLIFYSSPQACCTCWRGALALHQHSNINTLFKFVTVCQAQRLRRLLHLGFTSASFEPKSRRDPKSARHPVLYWQSQPWAPPGFPPGFFYCVGAPTESLLRRWELRPPLKVFVSEFTDHEKISVGVGFFFWILPSEFKFCLNKGKIRVSQLFVV